MAGQFSENGMAGNPDFKIDPRLVEDVTVQNCEAFDIFKSRYCYSDVKIDPFSAKTAVISWITDIKRHSVYHPSKNGLSKFKQAGYLLYWLVKIKAISSTLTKPPAAQDTPRYLAINEDFGVFLTLRNLELHPRALDAAAQDQLAYALFYRDNNAKNLVMLLEQIYKATPAYLRDCKQN